MNWTRPLVAPAVLAALITGCATAGPGQPTASGCATAAVQALQAGGPLASLPRPCRGLGPAALDQAVRITVVTLANDGDKAVRRHVAGRVRARLAVLISAQQVAARRAAEQRAAARIKARRTATPRARGTAGSRGVEIPVGLAALAAWLLTAASGSVLLVKWRAHARRHVGPGGGRPPPAILISHAGLAAGGLLTWSGYLITRAPALAWIALGVLLPVAGLGMAALIDAIPDPRSATGTAAEPAATARSVLPTATATATATVQVTAAAPPAAGRSPVLMIVTHGVLATATLLLALLGAIAALGAH